MASAKTAEGATLTDGPTPDDEVVERYTRQYWQLHKNGSVTRVCDSVANIPKWVSEAADEWGVRP